MLVELLVPRFPMHGFTTPPDPALPLAVPRFPRVSRLVGRWADATPDRAAVSLGDSTWSYRRLGEASDAIGASLGRVGVGAGHVVAVCGPPSFGLVASLLAVLSSDGVLLLVDPRLPLARRVSMLAGVDVRCLIGEEAAIAEVLPAVPGVALVRIDGEAAILGERPHGGEGARPRWRSNGVRGSAAYVFHTSGSTGEPKAVLGSHEGLAHFLSWQAGTFLVSPSDRVAQLTSLSFDVVLRDILLPLSSGATLVLRPGGGQDRPEDVMRWLRDERITLLHAVPTLARAWLDADHDTTRLPDLRVVFFAGEPLTGAFVTRWRERCSAGTTVVNLYGPTETTLAKCWNVIDDVPEAGTLPVGRPLPDTQVLVVSDAGDLLGPGSLGELVIRTPFATLGYVGERAAQGSGFGPNPWSDDRDDVVYRTGDLGRYRPDGRLEVVGRRDRQVKILGVRVDPAEVEAALASHPAVRHGVVGPVRDVDGTTRLTAWVTAVPGKAIDRAEVRTFLARRLPAAMVPSSVVVVTEIPRTANGKIDHAVLAAMERTAVGSGPRPTDELERRLLDLWRPMFPGRDPTVTDDFFELGGTSLLAARLFAAIEGTFGRSLPLGTLFEAPTPAALAAVIRRHDWLAPWSSLVRIREGGTRPPLFYVHPGGGNLLVYRTLTLGLPPDRPVYGLQPRGLDGLVDPFRTIEEMAAHYVALAVGVQPSGPVHLVGFSSGGLIALEMARRLRRSGRDVAFLGMIDTTGPGGYRPLPLPLRVASVIRWVAADRARRFASIVRARLARGRRADRSGPTGRAGVAASEGRAIDAIERGRANEKRRIILDRRTALFRSSRPSGPGKLVDTLLIDLLRRSSRPFFAGVLAEGVVGTPPEGASPHGRWIQELGDHASRVYVPLPYDGPLTYFQARSRPPGLRTSPKAGWAGVAVGDFALHDVSGDHASIIDSPELGPLLGRCLDAVEGRDGERPRGEGRLPVRRPDRPPATVRSPAGGASS